MLAALLPFAQRSCYRCNAVRSCRCQGVQQRAPARVPQQLASCASPAAMRVQPDTGAIRHRGITSWGRVCWPAAVKRRERPLDGGVRQGRRRAARRNAPPAPESQRRQPADSGGSQVRPWRRVHATYGTKACKGEAFCLSVKNFSGCPPFSLSLRYAHFTHQLVRMVGFKIKRGGVVV